MAGTLGRVRDHASGKWQQKVPVPFKPTMTEEKALEEGGTQLKPCQPNDERTKFQGGLKKRETASCFQGKRLRVTTKVITGGGEKKSGKETGGGCDFKLGK